MSAAVIVHWLTKAPTPMRFQSRKKMLTQVSQRGVVIAFI
jgi:hypothetical protein